jgi:hypothetical protein
MKHLQSLIVFDQNDLPDDQLPPGIEVIEITRLSGWQFVEKASLLQKSRLLRGWVTQFCEALVRSYFANRTTRRVLDRLGIMRLFVDSPFFSLPGAEARASLLAAIPLDGQLRVISDAPVLVEIWEHKGQQQIHLVNYANQPQSVRLSFPAPVSAKLLSPDMLFDSHVEGQDIELQLDIYTIMLVDTKKE